MALFNFAVAYFERFCLRDKVRVRSDNPRINVSNPKTATKKESRFSPCWPVMYTTAPPTIDTAANMKTAHFSLSISTFLFYWAASVGGLLRRWHATNSKMNDYPAKYTPCSVGLV
jgi:hypothetical protein